MRISVSKRADICIFKVKNRPFWYVKFWNEGKKIYSCIRSTGVPLVKPKALADKAARQLLTAGVLAAIDNLDTGFIAYLNNFWKSEGDYCRQAAAVKGKPMSKKYIQNNTAYIKNHIATYAPFAKITLADVTTGDLEKWQLWARERHGITGNTANCCLKLIKIALSQAAKRGEIPSDPSKAVTRANYETTEKGILTQHEADAICALPCNNPRRLLPVLLGLCCGMRRGEIRGLKWQDIQEGVTGNTGIIDIKHNWVDGEGLKSPKCGSYGKVPYGAAVAKCLEAVKATARHIDPTAFVLESFRIDGEPVTQRHFTAALAEVLSAIGMTPETQKARNITQHSMRHSFISLARLAGVDDLTVQTWARHSDLKMTDHYTHAAQVIDYEAYRAKFRLIA
ncbi:MAG: hypothetical protein Ta2B_08090 [Termitinemataceae bacterium]|nr:MAG: hypothetical protein Ta2B_08090 [Termitinemataceae bacterium]